MEKKHKLFWNQGDFGYVKNVKDSLVPICSADYSVCYNKPISPHLKFCYLLYIKLCLNE